MAVGLTREELVHVFLRSFGEHGNDWIAQKQGAVDGESPQFAQVLRDVQERMPADAPPHLTDIFGIMLAMSFATLDTIAANNEAIAKTLSA